MDDGLTGPQSDPDARTAFIGPETEAGVHAAAAAAATNEPDIGALQGRYVVLETIGRGAMGRVLRAYDPKLQREVALKIVSGRTLDPNARERMVREAQAMAQLSHPNVVPVYDTEESELGVVLVMEYVQGQTLREWSQASTHAWPEVVARSIAAGRGLAAAHSVGLLHRDFKPDNVLVADSGAVKVTDFGLAKLTSGARLSGSQAGSQSGSSQSGSQAGWSHSGESADASSGSIDMALTRAGTVMGTPRYMAPEQHRGDVLGPAADQYAFCVSLWEALVGRPPHGSKSLRSLLDEKLREPPPWPAGAPAIPRALVEALRRGLAADPSARFESMDALLAALAHDPRRRRNRWIMGLGGLGLVGGLGMGWWAWSTARAQQCTGASEQLVGVWDEARRDEVRDAMLAGASYAGPVWERTRAELDRYAGAWAAMHTEACEATTLRGEQSTEVLDLRMGCLHRARLGLEAVTAVLASADAEVTRKATEVVGSLAPLDRCADVERLRADVEPPRAEEAEAVEGIRKHVAEASAALEAGRYAQALELAETAARERTGVDYGPVVAEVSLVAGRALEQLGRYEEAEATYREALQSAARWRQWELMQEVAAALMFVVGYEQRRMAEAHQLWALAVGLAADDPGQEASARNILANLLVAEGRLAEAEVEHRRALELREGAREPAEADVAISRSNLGLVLHERGKYEEAEGEFRLAVAQIEQALGPGHPTGAVFRNNLGNALSAQGKHDEAEAELRQALGQMEQALGSEHPDVAMSMSNIAQVLQAKGDLAGSEALHRRALAIREGALEPGHPDIAQSLNNLGNVMHGQARYAEAVVVLRRALPLFEAAVGPEHANVAQVHSNLGLILHAQGKEDEAEAELLLAVAGWERALGPEHPTVAIGLNNLSLVHYAKGQYEAAEAGYRRILALQEQTLGLEHPNVALTRNNLAQVLVARGKLEEAEVEHRRALALTLTALGPEHPNIARSRNNLGQLLAQQGKHDEAEAELRQALALWEPALGPDHPNVAAARHNLAKVLLGAGRADEALELAELAWTRREREDTLADSRAATAFVLARALWSTSTAASVRARAKGLAERAQVDFEAAGKAKEAEEVREWLRRPVP